MVSEQGEWNMCVEGEETEEVQNMKYLGARFSEDGTKEIEHRAAVDIVIGATRKKVMDRSELRRVTTMRVYNAMVMSTMLYGCETWTVMKGHESRQQAMEKAQLRRVKGLLK